MAERLYRITVNGVLTARLATAFEPLGLSGGDGCTVLSGVCVDSAALRNPRPPAGSWSGTPGGGVIRPRGGLTRPRGGSFRHDRPIGGQRKWVTGHGGPP